jgi:hypothetical protein
MPLLNLLLIVAGIFILIVGLSALLDAAINLTDCLSLLAIAVAGAILTVRFLFPRR